MCTGKTGRTDGIDPKNLRGSLPRGVYLRPVSEVANKEKKVPLSWITEDGHDVTEEMMAYLRPLILGEPAMQYENGIPVHIELY